VVDRGHLAPDVARILGVPLQSLRELIEDSGLRPSEEGRFTFQDLVVLRAARRLQEARVPRRRIRAALRGLEEGLPQGTSLAAVRISASGGEVVVHDGETAWNPESGQVVLGFVVDDPAPESAEVVERRSVDAWESGELDAEGWYELGCELELAGDRGSADAYRRALDGDPHHFDANLNLGRCLHERGELDEAVERYERALAVRPDDALAAYNLGVAMEDLGKAEAAIDAYERALEADAECADAHFNVARLYERCGDTAAAVRHLKSYKRLALRKP
jgi:tetratricopeptide (TPR) repeat protein